MNPPKTLDELNELLARFNWTKDTDNDGQIVIYTGLRWDDDGRLIEIEGAY